MNLSNIVIILDHPDEPRNIGAACRAMANNDIKTLRIVGKKDDYTVAALEHIKVLAIHASYIFDNVEFFDSINDATKDCCFSAGTTRRFGKKRGKLLLPEEFAKMASETTDSEQSNQIAKTKEFKYSVETPTTNFYKFSGEDISELNQCIKFTDPQPTNAGETLPNTIPDTDKNGDDVINKSADLHNNSKFISARIDLTLYKSDASICHHIEFKAHNPAYKDIAKDILKLFWEPTCNGDTHYFFAYRRII